eukprot:1033684-Rhodomonas_salina.4
MPACLQQRLSLRKDNLECVQQTGRDRVRKFPKAAQLFSHAGPALARNDRPESARVLMHA